MPLVFDAELFLSKEILASLSYILHFPIPFGLVFCLNIVSSCLWSFVSRTARSRYLFQRNLAFLQAKAALQAGMRKGGPRGPAPVKLRKEALEYARLVLRFP